MLKSFSYREFETSRIEKYKISICANKIRNNGMGLMLLCDWAESVSNSDSTEISRENLSP